LGRVCRDGRDVRAFRDNLWDLGGTLGREMKRTKNTNERTWTSESSLESDPSRDRSRDRSWNHRIRRNFRSEPSLCDGNDEKRVMMMMMMMMMIAVGAVTIIGTEMGSSIE
jgi:hypothetical protein